MEPSSLNEAKSPAKEMLEALFEYQVILDWPSVQFKKEGVNWGLWVPGWGLLSGHLHKRVMDQEAIYSGGTPKYQYL